MLTGLLVLLNILQQRISLPGRLYNIESFIDSFFIKNVFCIF